MIFLLVVSLLQARGWCLPMVKRLEFRNDKVQYLKDGDFDMDFVFFTSILLLILFCYLSLTLVYFIIKQIIRLYFTRGIVFSSGEEEGRNWSRILDNEDEVRELLSCLSPEEQFYYKQGEEFVRQNPPCLLSYRPFYGSQNSGNNMSELFDPIINEQTLQYIEEEGAHVWEFQPSSNIPNDFITVENRTEITFSNLNCDVSVMTNLPIPLLNRVYYFECKIFEIHNNSSNMNYNNFLYGRQLISFGLATSPYPYFRLPGRHHHSIAYDSDGSRRLNNSFNLRTELASVFPRCEKGDIIGIGYRTRSGTVFFTKNGIKLKEKHIGGHIKGWKFKYVYPIVGANVPSKIHVNFGTYGFVFIEANVKKWGYAKADGAKLPPPTYEAYDLDMLLESSYEDELSEAESLGNISENGQLLPPPPGFEFTTKFNEYADQYTMGSLPANPPEYFSDKDSPKNKKVLDERINASKDQVNQKEDAEEHNEIAPCNIHENTFANQFVDTNSP